MSIRLLALFLAALAAAVVTGTAAAQGHGPGALASGGSSFGSWRVLLPVIVIGAAVYLGRWIAGGSGGRIGGAGRGWYRDIGGAGRPEDSPPPGGGDVRSHDTRRGHWRDGDWRSRDAGGGDSGADDESAHDADD